MDTQCVVVGAGVAGLQAARALLRCGVDVLLLEQLDTVGGVWTRNYDGFSVQVPYHFYQFPEFPWPDSIPKAEYPSGYSVREYVRAYAEHFDLLPHIRFRCQLARVQQRRSGGWHVIYMDHATGLFQKVAADFLVVCSGIYSLPFLPRYKGCERFKGLQVHAKDFQDRELARGRRVVVVGAGKSALDCASEVASGAVAASVTWLFRQAHWPVPRTLGKDYPLARFLFSRGPVALLPPFYTAGAWERAKHRAAAPLKALAWRSLERKIRSQFVLDGALEPPMPLDKDLFFGGQILDGTWNTMVSSGSIRPLHGEIVSMGEDHLQLQSGEVLEADLVLYCTGYAKNYDYLEGCVKARLGLQKDGLYLYRNCVPPAVPGLAFVGAEVSTFNNVLTSGLQAEWLARVISGRLALPSMDAMQADVRAQQKWRREVMPAQRVRGSVYQLYMYQYHAQLMQDMGLPPPRGGGLTEPLTAEHYRAAFTGGGSAMPALRTRRLALRCGGDGDDETAAATAAAPRTVRCAPPGEEAAEDAAPPLAPPPPTRAASAEGQWVWVPSSDSGAGGTSLGGGASSIVCVRTSADLQHVTAPDLMRHASSGGLHASVASTLSPLAYQQQLQHGATSYMDNASSSVDPDPADAAAAAAAAIAATAAALAARIVAVTPLEQQSAKAGLLHRHGGSGGSGGSGGGGGGWGSGGGGGGGFGSALAALLPTSLRGGRDAATRGVPGTRGAASAAAASAAAASSNTSGGGEGSDPPSGSIVPPLRASTAASAAAASAAAAAAGPRGGGGGGGASWPPPRASDLKLGADHTSHVAADPLAAVRLVVEQLQDTPNATPIPRVRRSRPASLDYVGAHGAVMSALSADAADADAAATHQQFREQQRRRTSLGGPPPAAAAAGGDVAGWLLEYGDSRGVGAGGGKAFRAQALPPVRPLPLPPTPQGAPAAALPPRAATASPGGVPHPQPPASRQRCVGSERLPPPVWRTVAPPRLAAPLPRVWLSASASGAAPPATPAAALFGASGVPPPPGADPARLTLRQVHHQTLLSLLEWHSSEQARLADQAAARALC